MSRVYLAREGDNTVALKIALRDSASVKALRRELRILTSLRHPGVVPIRDHGFDEGVPWYAMDFVEGEALDEMIGRTWSRSYDAVATVSLRHTGASVEMQPLESGEAPASLKEVVSVFTKLCQVLAFMHGEGIVHRDLKPANTLIRKDGTPCIIDFGLARYVTGGLGRETVHIDDFQGGTKFYMAPEQIRGQATDARADLYSLGCMLYESITGRPPFLPQDGRNVLDAHLEHLPVPPQERNPDVSDGLNALTLKLLSKDPVERVGYAIDVQNSLMALGAQKSPSFDTRLARPYLYHSDFIVPQHVFDRLDAALKETQENNVRMLCLFGDIGSGRTRIAREFAARSARAQKVHIITALCDAVSGDSSKLIRRRARPLASLYPVFRAVCDLCHEGGEIMTGSLIDEDIAMLAELFPEFQSLPGLPQRVDAPLTSESAHDRLVRAVIRLFENLSEHAPLLLVLDDVHWADDLTLDVLARLSQKAQNKNTRASIMVVMTARSEHELPERVVSKHIHVPAFSDDDLQKMMEHMLARESIPDVLMKEAMAFAQGNPYRLGEFLRVSVDTGSLYRNESGQWRLKEERPKMPDSDEKMANVRIKLLSLQAKQVLSLASVLGDGFPRETLEQVIERDAHIGIEELLAARILHEHGDTLRFTHHAFLSSAYASLDEAERREHHRAAIASLEKATSSSDVKSYEMYATLAYHAKRIGEPISYLAAAVKAGSLALSLGALNESRQIFSECSEVARQTKDLDSAVKAKALGGLGIALSELGLKEEAETHLVDALKLLNVTPPAKNSFAVAQTLALESIRLATSNPESPELETSSDDKYAALLCKHLMLVRFALTPTNGIACALLTANVANRADADGPRSQAYAILGAVTGFSGMHKLSARLMKRARESAQRSGQLEIRVGQAEVEAFYLMNRARWDDVYALMAPIEADCVAANALHLAVPSMVTTTMTTMLTHDFPTVYKSCEALRERALATGLKRFAFVSSIFSAVNALFAEDGRSALVHLQRTEPELESVGEVNNVANYYATRALANAMVGHFDQAMNDRERATELAGEKTERNWVLYNVHAFLPEVLLRLLYEGKDDTLEKELKLRVKRASQFSRTHEYARPMATRLRGEVSRLRGDVKAAHAHFTKAKAMAGDYKIPVEEARAYWALGERERARLLFNGLGDAEVSKRMNGARYESTT